MDNFFNHVASLMSNLLRSTVRKSLEDLEALIGLYRAGNNYNGDYHIFRDLAVPELKQPSTLFLVRLKVKTEKITGKTCIIFCIENSILSYQNSWTSFQT